LLLFGAEFFIFHFAIQKYKDLYVANYNLKLISGFHRALL